MRRVLTRSTSGEPIAVVTANVDARAREQDPHGRPTRRMLRRVAAARALASSRVEIDRSSLTRLRLPDRRSRRIRGSRLDGRTAPWSSSWSSSWSSLSTSTSWSSSCVDRCRSRRGLRGRRGRTLGPATDRTGLAVLARPGRLALFGLLGSFGSFGLVPGTVVVVPPPPDPQPAQTGGGGGGGDPATGQSAADGAPGICTIALIAMFDELARQPRVAQLRRDDLALAHRVTEELAERRALAGIEARSSARGRTSTSTGKYARGSGPLNASWNVPLPRGVA